MTAERQSYATLRREGGAWAVCFERHLAHDRNEVWRALTESEHLRHWLPCDIVGDRRPGARITLPFWPAQVERHNIATPTLHGEIRVWDPPSVFEWVWETDVLRWELTGAGDDTTLVFTTWPGPDDARAANTAAGYHACLDNLEALLDTGTAPPLEDADVAPLEAHYVEAVARPS